MKYEVLVSGHDVALPSVLGYREIPEKGVTQMNEGQEKDMTVEEMCKAAVAGEIKPSVELIEKAIGTPWELFLLPDGSVKLKHEPQGEVLPSVGSDDFKEDCFALRAQIEETKKQTMLVIQEHPVFAEEALLPEKHTTLEYAEMRANLKLTYRHLEDARMRLGKALQAFDGGKSIYPR